jgi:hypothetical protein
MIPGFVLSCNPLTFYRTLKWHFSTLEVDDRGLNTTRANACEIVAWRFLARLPERETVGFCLYELPPVQVLEPDTTPTPPDILPTESSRLLPQFRPDVAPSPKRPGSKRQLLKRSVSAFGAYVRDECMNADADAEEEDPTSSFTGLNALEIAAVADAKRFLSQSIVQKIIQAMWSGEIIFWDSLSVHASKKPRFYNQKTADPFSRLRVPKYIKTFEVLYFAMFLALYYGVLIERNPYRITFLEILLYIWIAAFAYDELSEYIDAGIFYQIEFWKYVFRDRYM